MIAPETQFIIYFIYGLTFFSMGLAMLLESWRVDPTTPQVGLLRPMAAFGLLHGAHEWLEIFLMQMGRLGEPIADYFIWIRLGLLATSFIALWFYSLAAFRFARAHITPLTVFGLVTLPLFALLTAADVAYAYWLGNVPFYRVVGGIVRYGLGVTGAAIATLGLRAAALKARADDRRPLDTHLNIAAFGFTLYSVTQIFVPGMNTTLATWINTENFQIWFGIPIQVVRTLTAMVITLGLFNATRFLETERQKVVAEAQKARLEAIEQQEAMQRELLRHTVRTQEEERARIARELHDETAQILTAFTLDLGTLQQLINRKSKAAPVITRLQDLGRQMSQDVNRMVRDLRPALLDDLGLVPALKFLVENDAPRLGLTPTFELLGAPDRLDPLTETVLFRIAQEALTNIARHARAHNACLELAFTAAKVELTISDDGIGFDPSQKLASPHGMGLAGMKERAESTGGQLQVESQSGKGTIIHISIPKSQER